MHIYTHSRYTPDSCPFLFYLLNYAVLYSVLSSCLNNQLQTPQVTRISRAGFSGPIPDAIIPNFPICVRTVLGIAFFS